MMMTPKEKAQEKRDLSMKKRKQYDDCEAHVSKIAWENFHRPAYAYTAACTDIRWR